MGLAHCPQIVTGGLQYCLDAANYRSYNTKNLFKNPTDIKSWVGNGDIVTNFGSVLRDTTVSSPVGNSPMKMNASSAFTYTETWGSSAIQKVVSSASQGETFTASVWAKSASGTTLADCSIVIFDADSNGSWNTNVTSTYTFGNFTATDKWQRFSLTRTTAWASTAYIQVRLDGPHSSTGTLWWDGLQVERSSTATDFSPNGPDKFIDISQNSTIATLVGSPSHNSDGYFTLNGSSQRIDCGTNFSSFMTGTNPFTIECWVYPGSSQVAYADIWGNHNDVIDYSVTPNVDYRYTGIVMQQDSTNTNSYSWGWGTGSAWAGGTGNFTLTANQWSHVVAVRTPTWMYSYVNGVDVTNGAKSSSMAPNGQFNFMFGHGYRTAVNRYFNGRISNCKVYDVALSAAQVKQNFNAHRGRYGL